MYFFATRPILLELHVPTKVSTDKFHSFFGDNGSLDDRLSAHSFLKERMDIITETLESWVRSKNTLDAIQDLYTMFYAVQENYKNDREQRKKLKEIGAQGDSLAIYESNRNIALCIIEAVNIWIENTVLLNIHLPSATDFTSEIDIDLLLNLYIYGLVSRTLSLIALSDKFKDYKSFRGYSGVAISPDCDVPIEPKYARPVIYVSPLISGNQSSLSFDKELAQADKSPLGKAFKRQYNMELLHFVALLYSIEKTYKQPYIIKMSSISDFKKLVKSSIKVPLDADQIINAFALSRKKMEASLKPGDQLIWRSGVNKFRFELCPFIIHNNSVLILSAALERSRQLWASYVLNGGLVYTDCKDSLYSASDEKNNELSTRLVTKLNQILEKNYPHHFNDTDVYYDRIWDVNKYPKSDCDYGDFDVVFYNKTDNELFLIEAKFFSDALHASRMVSDYEKLFSKGGYYGHCRKRYDLFLSDPNPMKEFIGASGKEIKVHLLFVSSKHLEVEFQDEDKVVTFLCLENFSKYINGKLLSEEDESIIIRPIRSI